MAKWQFSYTRSDGMKGHCKVTASNKIDAIKKGMEESLLPELTAASAGVNATLCKGFSVDETDGAAPRTDAGGDGVAARPGAGGDRAAGGARSGQRTVSDRPGPGGEDGGGALCGHRLSADQRLRPQLHRRPRRQGRTAGLRGLLGVHPCKGGQRPGDHRGCPPGRRVLNGQTEKISPTHKNSIVHCGPVVLYLLCCFVCTDGSGLRIK